MNRFSLYGKRGGPVEQVTVFLGPSRIWRYGGFGSDAPIEGSETANLMAQLKGGWSISGRLKREFVRFDPAMYGNYQVVCPAGCLSAYRAPAKMAGAFSANLTAATPIYRTFNARAEVLGGEVAIFPEAAEGRETRAVVGVNLRPTGSIRLEATTTLSRILRQRDDSEFARTVIPRLKVEYQPTRALFVRVVGEYRSERQAALMSALDGTPLYVGGSLAGRRHFDGFRLDLLFSFEPSPGTVVFVGYGSSMESPIERRWTDLDRTSDGLFVKLAYLFRR